MEKHQLICELVYDYDNFVEVLTKNKLNESFFVRAYFNLNFQMINERKAFDVHNFYSNLEIISGDVFHVTDTLIDNKIGYWLVCLNYYIFYVMVW